MSWHDEKLDAAIIRLWGLGFTYLEISVRLPVDVNAGQVAKRGWTLGLYENRNASPEQRATVAKERKIRNAKNQAAYRERS